MKLSKVIKCLLNNSVLKFIILLLFLQIMEQIVTRIPVAQPTPAVIGTTIMPTPVILSVTDAEVVPIII